MECKTKLLHNLDTVEVKDGIDKHTITTSCLVLPPQLLQGSDLLKALIIALNNSIITPLHSAV